jgi:hypothetical protein
MPVVGDRNPVAGGASLRVRFALNAPFVTSGVTNWMTAAGIALIAGGLATLISFRAVLFGGGGRRRDRRAVRAARAGRVARVGRAAQRARVAQAVQEAAAQAGHPAPVARAAAAPRRRKAAAASAPAVRDGSVASPPVSGDRFALRPGPRDGSAGPSSGLRGASIAQPSRSRRAGPEVSAAGEAADPSAAWKAADEQVPVTRRRGRRGRRRTGAAASGGLASIGLADDEPDGEEYEPEIVDALCGTAGDVLVDAVDGGTHEHGSVGDKALVDGSLDEGELDQDALDHEGPDHEGLDREGLDREGLDREGLDREGLDREGLDREALGHGALGHEALDHEALDEEGLDRESLHREELGDGLEDVLDEDALDDEDFEDAALGDGRFVMALNRTGAESRFDADHVTSALNRHPGGTEGVRRVDRSARGYGDRVDGWVRPQYRAVRDEPPSGEYWTPIPVDLTGDDPEPSAKGYGWPMPVERLPAVPSYEPATGFDLAPVEAEPTEVVPAWPPLRDGRRRRSQLPPSWAARNEKPDHDGRDHAGGHDRAHFGDEPAPTGRQTRRANRRRSVAAAGPLPPAGDSTQLFARITDEPEHTEPPNHGWPPTNATTPAAAHNPAAADDDAAADFAAAADAAAATNAGPGTNATVRTSGARGSNPPVRTTADPRNGVEPGTGIDNRYPADLRTTGDPRNATERRRPRPRPRPDAGPDRSTVYVSRHAAEPPR